MIKALRSHNDSVADTNFHFNYKLVSNIHKADVELRG